MIASPSTRRSLLLLMGVDPLCCLAKKCRFFGCQKPRVFNVVFFFNGFDSGFCWFFKWVVGVSRMVFMVVLSGF